jgi:hypothetical protein
MATRFILFDRPRRKTYWRAYIFRGQPAFSVLLRRSRRTSVPLPPASGAPFRPLAFARVGSRDQIVRAVNLSPSWNGFCEYPLFPPGPLISQMAKPPCLAIVPDAASFSMWIDAASPRGTFALGSGFHPEQRARTRDEQVGGFSVSLEVCDSSARFLRAPAFAISRCGGRGSSSPVRPGRLAHGGTARE